MDLNSIIDRIEVTFAGMHIDKLNTGNIYDEIMTSCALYDPTRMIQYIHPKKVFVPLVMAPFYRTNLVFPSSTWHDLVIHIKSKHKDLSFTFFANKYYFTESHRKFIVDTPHTFNVYQHQYCGKDILHPGVNRIKLSYIHPITTIIFIGLDKTKVKKIKLLLDDRVYFEGSIDFLENFKKARLKVNVEPVVLFISQSPMDEIQKSTINMSRIDNPVLEIETDQENDSDLHIVAMNTQPFMYLEGMVGLRFGS